MPIIRPRSRPVRTVNPLQPVEVVTAIEDGSGVGFSLVWLTDKDGGLWMCDADATGAIYSYSLVKGDLLDGTDRSSERQFEPRETARNRNRREDVRGLSEGRQGGR
jgi:hypothetical protein